MIHRTRPHPHGAAGQAGRAMTRTRAGSGHATGDRDVRGGRATPAAGPAGPTGGVRRTRWTSTARWPACHATRATPDDTAMVAVALAATGPVVARSADADRPEARLHVLTTPNRCIALGYPRLDTPFVELIRGRAS
jgi:hypothetical protein